MKSRTEYGADYVAWKEWGGNFATLQPGQRAYLSAEIGRTGLKHIDSVLDIGFGNGNFLRFAKERGWHVVGTETNPELLRIGRQHKFDVLGADELAALPGSSFDLITAFDVLEHIPDADLPALLSTLRSKLRTDGVLLARFPNGDSPLGLAYQHGDLTHTTILGRMKAEYFAQMSDLAITYIRGQSEPIICGSVLHSARRLIAVPVKAAAEMMLRALFFPEVQRGFLSPNLVVGFQRRRT